MAQRYRETVTETYTEKIRKITKKMPPYAKGFIDSKADSMEVRSRYEYARDIMLFLRYCKDNIPECRNINIEEIPADTIEKIHPDFIDGYKEFLTVYTTPDGIEHKNGKDGKSTKLAVLRSFYKHLNKRGIVSTNPAALVDMPKKSKNEIITMKPEQEAELLRALDNSEGRSIKEKELFERNHIRDKAIVLMLLGTGLRISELIGLDTTDIDLSEKTAKIIRKGGDHDTVYFSDQVADALKKYLENTKQPGTRLSYNPKPDEKALFLTIRHTRYTVRALQSMIKKYVRELFGEDTKLSAHKMRATFGTSLYRDTGDMKLAQEALHHKSISTTEKHYIGFDEEMKKKAARTVPTMNTVGKRGGNKKRY